MFSSTHPRIIPRKQPHFARIILISLLGAFIFLGIPWLLFSTRSQSEISYIFLFAGFQFLLIVTVVGFALYETAALKDAWEELASRLGAQYSENEHVFFIRNPFITGTYKGYPFQLARFRRGKAERVFIEFQIRLPTQLVSEGLFIERMNLSNWAGKYSEPLTLEGFAVSQTGDEDLDQLAVIHTHPFDFANRMFANPTIRQGLKELVSQAQDMRLSLQNNELRFYERTLIRDVEYLQAVLDFLIEMVRQAEKLAGH